jgi:hypothetical protein
MLNDFAVGPPGFDFTSSALDAKPRRRVDAIAVGGIDHRLALDPPGYETDPVFERYMMA